MRSRPVGGPVHPAHQCAMEEGHLVEGGGEQVVVRAWLEVASMSERWPSSRALQAWCAAGQS
eukprot:12933574-Prorocentrum_lima.AAC.1